MDHGGERQEIGAAVGVRHRQRDGVETRRVKNDLRVGGRGSLAVAEVPQVGGPSTFKLPL